MSATYDSSLATDKDWVRFLLPDTDTTDPLFQDEEINAQLAEQNVSGQAAKYFAAADLLGLLGVRLANAGQGVESIRVGSLTITQGVSASSGKLITDRVTDLRAQGNYYLSLPGNRVIRLLGARRGYGVDYSPYRRG